MNRRRLILTLVGTAATALAPAVLAQTTTWVGGFGALWNVTGNWSAGVPAAGNIILFDPDALSHTLNLFGVSSAPVERVQFAGATLPPFTITSGGGALNLQADGLIRITASHGPSNQTISAATVFAGNGAITNSGLQGGLLTLSSVAASGILSVGGDGTIVIDGPISGNGVTKTGAGLARLTAANTYDGPTIITGGTLEVSHLADGGQNSGLGRSSSAAGNLILNGGALRIAGAGANSTDRRFSLGPAGGTIERASGATITLDSSGAIACTDPGTPRILTLAGQGQTAVENDIFFTIADGPSTPVGIHKTDPAPWRIIGRGAGNSFTGPVTVSAGVLHLYRTGAEGNNAPYAVNAPTGRLLITTESPETDIFDLGSLSGGGFVSGTSSLANETCRVAIGGNHQDSTFTGRLEDGHTPTGRRLRVTKVGGGTLTLAGQNTFTGGLFIDDGVLELGTGGATGSVVGNIQNNAALIINRSSDLSLIGGGPGAMSLTGPGLLIKRGAGALTIGDGPTGSIAVEAGTLRVHQLILGAVGVSSGATLTGNGRIGGPVVISAGGVITTDAAGPAPLTLQQDLTINGMLRVQVLGPASYGVIDLESSNVTLGATATLDIPSPQGVFTHNDWIALLVHVPGGNTTGAFAGLPDNGAAGTPVPQLAGFGGNAEWRIYYHARVAARTLTDGNDVVLVPTEDPCACTADHNCDGDADSSDFFSFLEDFFAQDLEADIDDSGAVDSTDFFSFLSSFFLGC